MKRERSDTQTIVLTTKKRKEEIKDKSLELGYVTKSGEPCMSDFHRTALDYALKNYQRVEIIDFDGLEYVLKLSDSELIDAQLLQPNNDKETIQDQSIVCSDVIVDFIDEKTAICIDVLD